ncbi:hypothetical protein Tco_0929119 [Tanacetum coccineum]
MINSMLITSGAPHILWGEACLAANIILNKIPHKKSDKSLYQLSKGKQSSYKRMKVWGLFGKGPAKNNAAYRFLVYKSNIDKDKQFSNPRKRVLDDQLSQDQRDNASEVPQENFELRRNMGEANVILGIRIQKNSNGYIHTQSHYIEKALKKFRHYDDRPVVTPFNPKV